MELTCTQTIDTDKNSSTIDWTLTTKGGNSGYYSTGPTSVIINGTTVYSKERVAWNSYIFPADKGSTNGTLTVKHDSKGKKSIEVSFSTAIKEATVETYKGTWELDSIPRYATVKQTLKYVDEETIKIGWSSDSVIDYLWCSADDGDSWQGFSVNDKTSGSYTISKRQEGTWYDVKTRVRRKDSQLTTDSDALRVRTYEYPCCVTAPDFVIGERVKLEFSNPLHREITFKIIANGVTLTHDWVTTEETYTGLNAESTQTELYNSIPNAQSGKYKVTVTYNGHTITTDEGNTYSVNPAVCKPTFGGFTYKDSSKATITGNDQILIKRESSLRVTIPSANKMTAIKGATPKYYIATIDDTSVKADFKSGDVVLDFGRVNTAGIKRLNVRAYDSRGVPSDAIYKDITVCEYDRPVFNIDAKRLNNFEEETTLKISGTYSPLIINGVEKNTITSVTYYYAPMDGTADQSYEASYSASNGKFTCDDITLKLDRDKAYFVFVIITDKAGGIDFLDTQVDVGQAIFMISSNKKACFINGVEVPTFESMYPVGSVYCSSTNTNPGEIYGGTWELIDKGFKTGSTEIEQPASAFLSKFTVASVRSGQTVRLRIHLTTTVDITDTQVMVDTINLKEHGLVANDGSYFLYGIFGGVAMSDGGNATITYDLNNSGELDINDCLNIDGTHVLPAGSSFYINAVITTTKSRMNDEFCDKFYWKRTA